MEINTNYKELGEIMANKPLHRPKIALILAIKFKSVKNMNERLN